MHKFSCHIVTKINKTHIFTPSYVGQHHADSLSIHEEERETLMEPIKLNAYYTLICATIVLLIGRLLVRKIKFLRDLRLLQLHLGSLLNILSLQGYMLLILIYLLNQPTPH